MHACPLSRAVCRALDEHVGDGSRRVGRCTRGESAGADREAAVVKNALLYHSRNRSSGGCGSPTTTRPFVHAEADRLTNTSVARRPATPPPRAVQNEGFADLARQRGEEDAAAVPARGALAVAADRRRAAREARRAPGGSPPRPLAGKRSPRGRGRARRRRDDERKRHDALARKAELGRREGQSDAAAAVAREAARAEAKREAAPADAVDAAAARLRRWWSATATRRLRCGGGRRRREKKARERQLLCGNQCVGARLARSRRGAGIATPSSRRRRWRGGRRDGGTNGAVKFDFRRPRKASASGRGFVAAASPADAVARHAERPRAAVQVWRRLLFRAK